MSSYKESEIGALIVKCREHDDEAFAEVVGRYTPMMRKVISGFLDLGVDYDELFSDACIALLSAINSFDLSQTEVTFGLYARRCVYNRLVDSVRERKGASRFVDIDLDAVSVSGPESQIVRKESFEIILKKASSLLSDYEYKVLLLHIQGYKTSVIAKMLGKSPKSVDNAKFRLFARLREVVDAP